MPRILIKEQRIFVLKQWWISRKTSQTVNATLRHKFPNEEVPTGQAMSRSVKKFDETNSIEDAPRSGRPVTVRTEENRELVSRTFHLNTRTLQRRESHDLNISLISAQCLMKDLNLKPYKPRFLQALNKDDPDRRLEFCEWILNSTQDD